MHPWLAPRQTLENLGAEAALTRKIVLMAASVEKDSSGEEYPWADRLDEHNIRGWRAVSAAGSQGKGLRKTSVFSQTPV